jgi:hypothetical protein
VENHHNGWTRAIAVKSLPVFFAILILLSVSVGFVLCWNRFSSRDFRTRYDDAPHTRPRAATLGDLIVNKQKKSAPVKLRSVKCPNASSPLMCIPIACLQHFECQLYAYETGKKTEMCAAK